MRISTRQEDREITEASLQGQVRYIMGEGCDHTKSDAILKPRIGELMLRTANESKLCLDCDSFREQGNDANLLCPGHFRDALWLKEVGEILKAREHKGAMIENG